MLQSMVNHEIFNVRRKQCVINAHKIVSILDKKGTD